MSERSIPVGGFCWEELQSRDLEKALPFYKALIGWETKAMPLPEGGSYTLFGPEDAWVAGGQPHAPRETGDWTGWLSYVSVQDVDHVALQAAELGGAIVCPPHDIPGVGRSAVLRDPEGVVFAVLCLLRPAEDPEEPLRSVCWRELMVRDAPRAVAFYTALLGWTTQVMPMGELGDYTLLLAGGRQVAGLMAITPQFGSAPAMWTPYVAVADVDACAARALELGGSLCCPPMDVPKVGRFCTVTDPAGDTLALITLKA